jgi:hypothetical protein
LWAVRWARSTIGVLQVPVSDNARSAAAIRRKLRAIGAVLADSAATENERANAQALKLRLQKQLGPEVAPEGAWSGILFRLGRGVRQIKQMKQSSTPPAPKGDWTDNAYRLGRLFRKGLKK